MRPRSMLFLDRDIRLLDGLLVEEGDKLIDTPVRRRLFPKDAQKAPVEHPVPSGYPRGKYIVHEPIAVDLAEGGVSKQSGCHEHLVRGLEHSLQVGRVSLG